MNVENFNLATEHFTDDIDARRLRTQLDMLYEIQPFQQKQASNCIEVANGLLTLEQARYLYSEVIKVLQFLLTVPASSATAEKSFSTLRRLKNYIFVQQWDLTESTT